MQFCQPTGFQPLALNYSYGLPCNPGYNAPAPPHVPYDNRYPEIIGEGNVTRIVSPDGTTHLIFTPTMQWPQCRTSPQNGYGGNFNNPYIHNVGAWLVRNMCNPTPSPFFSPQPYDGYNPQYGRGSSSDYPFSFSPQRPTQPCTGYALKFHNDNCTSTSDIRYFIPKQCSWFRCPSRAAAVQVETPALTNAGTNCEAPSSHDTACAKPCECPPGTSAHSKDDSKQKIKCMCPKPSKSSSSRMSVDSTRSKRKRRRKEKRHKSKRRKSRKPSHCECHIWSESDKGMKPEVTQRFGCANTSNSNMSVDSARSKRKSKSKKSSRRRDRITCSCSDCVDKTTSNTSNSAMSIGSTESTKNQRKAKLRQQKRKSRKSNHTCECKERPVDKSVTTYADQQSGCEPDKGRETQTGGDCSSGCSIPVIRVSRASCQSEATSETNRVSTKQPPKPKPSTSKKAKKSQSVDSVHKQSKTVSHSSTCTCTCTSDSELEDY